MDITCEVITDKVEIKNLLDMFIDLLPALQDKMKRVELCEKLFANAKILVIKHKGNIIGFSSFYANDFQNHIAYLSLIAVSEGFQGKQIGTLLLKKTEKLARANKMRYLKLEVRENNTKATSFYKKNDYQIVEENSHSFYLMKEL